VSGPGASVTCAAGAALATPNGTCTIGMVPPADFKWLIWSSKKMCGRNSASKRDLSMPRKKKVSSADTPQLFKVVTTRSCDGALRAVMRATLTIFFR